MKTFSSAVVLTSVLVIISSILVNAENDMPDMSQSVFVMKNLRRKIFINESDSQTSEFGSPIKKRSGRRRNGVLKDGFIKDSVNNSMKNMKFVAKINKLKLKLDNDSMGQ
jgi:hypothetical protein